MSDLPGIEEAYEAVEKRLRADLPEEWNVAVGVDGECAFVVTQAHPL